MTTEKSISTEQESEIVVYGEDMGLRILSGICGLLTLGMVGVSICLLFGPLFDHTLSPVLCCTVGILGIALCGGLTVALARYTGPNRLHIDFAQRVYTFTRGYLFFPKVVSGPLDDIKEVFLKTRVSRGGVCWLMMAGWKQPKNPDFRLKIFMELPKAQEQTQALAARLGVPADPEPRSMSLWD